MSAYLIETRASGFTKQTVYKTGDKFAAQAYTEDLPTGESTEKFTADPVTRVKDQKDPGMLSAARF